ncbi:MAG: cell division protein FtsA [Hyphomicrobiaceae bacterium]
MLTRTNKAATEEVISLLDVGSFKTTCLIVGRRQGAQGSAVGQPPARILGIGQCRSQGIKAGTVTDLNLAEETVRAAVGRAEAQSGLRVEEVIVAATCGRIGSTNFRASATVGQSRVKEVDVDRVLTAAERFAATDGRSLLHMHGLGYRLDDTASVVNPIGMAAERLSLDVNAVTADEAPIRNLTLLIERCYLRVAEVYAAPYASALAAMTEEEAKLGVTVVDMGGGTTSLASFLDGQLVHVDAIAVGGNHLTYDIARTLSTPLAEAERIKTLYANLMGAHSDEHDLVSFPVTGEEGGVMHHTSKARLRQIVRPRVEEILGLIRERLSRAGYGEAVSNRFVLAGGASELVGLLPFATRELGGVVRLGTVRTLQGVPRALTSPSLAAVAGLAGLAPAGEQVWRLGSMGTGSAPGYLGRVGRWLRESFWDDESRTATTGT